MGRHAVIIIILVFVILMVHNPARTTRQITSGENGLIGLGDASLQGAFVPTRKTSRGK